MPKIITYHDMQIVKQKHNALWKPSLLFKYDKDKRKMYWFTCECGKSKWILWRKFQQGESRGCRSCMRKKWSVKTDSAYYPLKKIWYNINRSRHSHIPIHWESYDHFKSWAFDNGYTDGYYLKRKSRLLGYSSENCYWKRGRVTNNFNFVNSRIV
jgi:hypothetical protein